MQYSVLLLNEKSLKLNTGLFADQRSKKPENFGLWQQNQFQGFTLIELLVSIAIIGLLASVVLVAVADARKRSRDARRLADVKQMITALTLYYDKYKNYPPTSHSGCYDGWETTCDAAGNFIDVLRTEGLMAKTAFDPVNNSSYFYAYYRYGAGSSGCASPYAVIAIKKFETNNPNIGVSAKCPSRNWYPEFDYSVLLSVW